MPMKEFKDMIEEIQTNPDIDYEKIGNTVQDIVAVHEDMEKRIYDLEHDVKVRDDKLGEMKKENFDLSQKITSKKEQEEDNKKEDEPVVKLDDIFTESEN